MAAFLFRVVSCLRRLVTRVLPGVGDVAGGCCQARRLLGSIFWHSCRAFAVREVDFSGKQAEIRLKVAKNQKKSRFDEKKLQKFCSYGKMHYLCTRNQMIKLMRTLGYGVMVTLQILVLSFLVRVRVSQQGGFQRKPFLFTFISVNAWRRKVQLAAGVADSAKT